jgi:hypothetical protein
MDSQPAIRTFEFSPQLDQAEIENRCARESFTWGPEAVWLLCGLIWLFYLLVRDVPELAWNAMLFGMAQHCWQRRRRGMRFDAANGKWSSVLCGTASAVIAETASNTAFCRKRWSGCSKIFLVDSSSSSSF